MSKRWKSSEDAARDLAQLNEFGGGNVEELRARLSEGSSNRPDTPQPESPKFYVDPRTGEEIDIRKECLETESGECSSSSSLGRGKLIAEFKQRSKMKALQKQLRMNRPLGFGNSMIESYFTKGEMAEETQSTSQEADSTTKVTSSKSKKRNVLMSTLLEKSELQDELVYVKKSGSRVESAKSRSSGSKEEW